MCTDIHSCNVIHRGYGLLEMISTLVLCIFQVKLMITAKTRASMHEEGKNESVARQL